MTGFAFFIAHQIDVTLVKVVSDIFTTFEINKSKKKIVTYIISMHYLLKMRKLH